MVMTPIRDLEDSAPYGVYFAGDASKEARTRLHALLNDRNAPRPMRGDPGASEAVKEMNLDWEPVEVLQRLIEDPNVRTVGGVPQLLKIYQNGLTETFVWRDDSGDYFGGRMVKHGERFDRRVARFVDKQLELSYSDRSMAATAWMVDFDQEI